MRKGFIYFIRVSSYPLFICALLNSAFCEYLTRAFALGLLIFASLLASFFGPLPRIFRSVLAAALIAFWSRNE